MMAADTVLQQYFTELQSEVKAIAVNADLETAYTELEGAFTEQVSRLMSEMGLLAAEPELCPFQGTVNGAVARVSAYAVSDDLDRMDVFVTLYESSSEVFEVKADEAGGIPVSAVSESLCGWDADERNPFRRPGSRFCCTRRVMLEGTRSDPNLDCDKRSCEERPL